MHNDFSILMSVYAGDKPKDLRAAFESLLEQTDNDFSLIVVRDGEVSVELEDVVSEFINKFSIINAKFIYLPLVENVGLGAALNYGLKHCNSNYVIRMDSDDISRSERVKCIKKVVNENPDIDVHGWFIEEFLDEPNDLGKKRSLPISAEGINKLSYLRNPINHVTVCFKKKSVESVGGYMHMLYHEDYFLWIRMLNSNMKLINHPKILVDVRIGNDMVGRRKGLSFLKHELNFAINCNRVGYFSFLNVVRYILPRIPLRLLPKSLLAIVYRKYLRSN